MKSLLEIGKGSVVQEFTLYTIPFFVKLTVFKIVAIIFAKACSTKEFWQKLDI